METAYVHGRVGPNESGLGNEAPLRLGNQCDQIVSMLHGALHETTYRGNLFWASTAVAGVAPGTVFSTTPPMALWNPANSSYYASIKLVYLAYVSGTLGAGFMAHGQILGQTTVPTGGTELTPQSGLLVGMKGVMRAFQASTFIAAPTIVRPSFSMGPALATTVVFPFLNVDEVNGSIQVPPGSAWAFQGAALGAGTSPLVIIGVGYGQVPCPK